MPESKYAYDEESVKAIIEWAQTTQLPKEVMLSEAEHIFDRTPPCMLMRISAILSSTIRIRSTIRPLTGCIG